MCEKKGTFGHDVDQDKHCTECAVRSLIYTVLLFCASKKIEHVFSAINALTVDNTRGSWGQC